MFSKLPSPVVRVGWVGLFLACLFMVVVQLSRTAVGPDYCAMAELATCRVVQSGTWTIVTTPSSAAYILIFDKAGKLTQVQKIQ